MAVIVPCSVAWPCKKLKPCKKKKTYKNVLSRCSYEYELTNENIKEDTYVEVDIETGADEKEMTTPKNSRFTETNKHRQYVFDKLKEDHKKPNGESLAASNVNKKEDDDVETDRKTIEWLNQSSFFHRGGGTDSSKSHAKGSASSFDKFSKVEDSKDAQKDDLNFSKNTSQISVDKSKDERPKDNNFVGSTEELTKLLFKYHTTRYKEFKRQVYSLNDSDSKPGHHSDRHDSTESNPKSYRSNYSYRSSYSRERGHDRHKYKSDR